MFEKLKSVIKTPEIEFLCTEEDKDVIAEPTQTKKTLPNWYKKLPAYIDNCQKLENTTVKKCAPFMDAMTIGWIIPLAVDIQIETNSDCSQFKFHSNYHREIVQSHKMEQITSKSAPNPICPTVPLKFLNWWIIRTPKDYSVLFVPPLNRPDHRFTCFSGIVECDKYFNFIHFPFTWHIPNYTGIIKAGTPLVQAIPIKRNTLIKKSSVKAMTKQQDEESFKLVRKIRGQQGYYRDQLWESKFK